MVFKHSAGIIQAFGKITLFGKVIQTMRIVQEALILPNVLVVKAGILMKHGRKVAIKVDHSAIGEERPPLQIQAGDRYVISH